MPTYTCSSITLSSSIYAGGTLRLISPHENPVIIPGGNNFDLSCTLVEDEGDLNITWYHNNVPRASSNGILRLINPNITDGGWYTCATSSAVERYELDFLVVVGGEMLMISVCETTFHAWRKYHGLCILTGIILVSPCNTCVSPCNLTVVGPLQLDNPSIRTP